MPSDDDRKRLITGCRLDAAFVPEGIRILGLHDEPIIATSLRAMKPTVLRDVIKAVRSGEPVQLEADAITYRQGDHGRPDYKPNSKGVRHKRSAMSSLARSYVGAPFLYDHRSTSQSARKGTITASKLVELANGELVFRQTLHVVKADAVESVLDGTIDRFSIAWDPVGPVTCSFHGGLARIECACWPLDVVKLDGVTKIVEYEFSKAKAREVSSVVTPAVEDTHIEDIRSALDREINPNRKQKPMRYARLAAILMMSAPAEGDDLDEDRAIAAAEKITKQLSTVTLERDAFRLRAETAETSLAEKTAAEAVALAAKKSAEDAAAAAAELAKLDAAIEAGYQAGKLRRVVDAEGKPQPGKMEGVLRAMAPDAAFAQLADLPVIVPLGQLPETRTADPLPAPTRLTRGRGTEISETVLASTAKQLGLTVEELKAQHAAKRGEIA